MTGVESHFWEGAGLGILIGAVGTAVFFATTVAEGEEEEGLVVFVGAMGGAIGGLILGGTAGALIKSEKWEPL